MTDYTKMLRAPGAEGIQDECRRLIRENRFKGQAHTIRGINDMVRGYWYEPTIEDLLGMGPSHSILINQNLFAHWWIEYHNNEDNVQYSEIGCYYLLWVQHEVKGLKWDSEKEAWE